MSIKGTITGRVVAEPTDKRVSNKFSVLEFPLYSDRRVKNRDTNEWESDPNGTTKLRVSLKFDIREEWLDKIEKGDVVQIEGTFYERAYEGKNGTGRSLETDYVDSISIISKSATSKLVPKDDDTPF